MDPNQATLFGELWSIESEWIAPEKQHTKAIPMSTYALTPVYIHSHEDMYT